MRVLAILLLTITLNLIPGQCQPVPPQGHTPYRASEFRNTWIKILICKYALRHQIKPAAALAVAHIESRELDKHGDVCQEFRVGLHGKYWLPMGIYDPRGRMGVDDLERNIEVGVKALRRFGPVENDEDLMRVLRIYNASFNGAYWNQVKKSERKYEKELAG